MYLLEFFFNYLHIRDSMCLVIDSKMLRALGKGGGKCDMSYMRETVWISEWYRTTKCSLVEVIFLQYQSLRQAWHRYQTVSKSPLWRGKKKKKSLSAYTAQCAGAVHTKQLDLDDFPWLPSIPSRAKLKWSLEITIPCAIFPFALRGVSLQWNGIKTAHCAFNCLYNTGPLKKVVSVLIRVW